MGEVLIDHNTQPSASPEQVTPDGSLSYRERLRQGLGRVVEGGFSLVDLGAGVALALDDLRLTRKAMRQLDEPYGGLIERQAAGDALSVELKADIMLDFRRDAQVAGFADVDAMPSEQRLAVAAQSAGARTADVAIEIAAAHVDWSPEDIEAAVATRVADITTVLGMDAQERDEYFAAQLEYLELCAAIPEISAELHELRAERNERLMRIGGAAVRGVVGLAGRLRDVPTAVSAKVMLTGMAVGDRLNALPEKRRKAFWGTAAGVAVAGLAGYVAMRAGMVGHGGGTVLASYNMPLSPNHVGPGLPDQVGTVVLPTGVGTPTIDHASVLLPTRVGTPPLPDSVGNVMPPTPNSVGTPALPTSVGTPNAQPLPTRVGTQMLPTSVGTGNSQPLPSSVGTPNHAGGIEDLTSAKTSDRLFAGSTPVDKWPDVVTVSHWDPHDLDGSLTGIAHQMLVRAGVRSPSQTQLNTLIDSMRPQARPNGYLLYGQKLDLRPAVKALQTIL